MIPSALVHGKKCLSELECNCSVTAGGALQLMSDDGDEDDEEDAGVVGLEGQEDSDEEDMSAASSSDTGSDGSDEFGEHMHAYGSMLL